MRMRRGARTPLQPTHRNPLQRSALEILLLLMFPKKRAGTCALGGAPPAELGEAQDVGWDGQRLRGVLLTLVVHLLQVLQLRNRVRRLGHVLRCGMKLLVLRVESLEALDSKVPL